MAEQQKQMRYGDLDDDEDEYLSDDEPRQGNSGGGGGTANDEEDEYAREQRAADMAAAQALPPNVKSFITSLKNAMTSNNPGQIHNLYTVSFPRLTNEHYASAEWPEVEVVQCLVDNNEVFGIFYRELYFRHIYSRLQPNIDDRFSSYENYCAIFNYILNSNGPVPIELPAQWLWDLVDEFVWQFASFAQWRSRPKGKTDEEVALLAENPQVWSCYSVLNVLYSLIQKSKIQDQLRAVKKGEDAEEVGGEYGSKPLYRMLGTYSMVTLVRVHALLGDYTLALKMLDDIDMKRLPTRDVPAAHVSVHYYVGFSYLMIQRYSDAIYHLGKGFLFYAGPKRGSRNAPSGNDAIAKQADRMLALLAVAHALSAAKYDDSREVREARDALRTSEKYNEQFETMSRGGEAALTLFEELFKYGAPKTISPHSPPYDNPELLESYPDTVQHTINLFMSEVKTIVDVSDLRTLLKLYTSIGTKKLATLAGKDEDDLVRELMVLKGSMVTTKWTEPSTSASSSNQQETAGLLYGEEVVVGNLGFNLDGDSINVTETRRAKQFTGRFLSQGLAAKGLLDQLRSRPLPTPVVAGQLQNTGSSSSITHFHSHSQSQSQNRPQPAVAAPGGGKGVAWVK